MKFHQLLAFSAAALAWDFKLAILAPEAIRDTIVGSGKVSDIDGEIEPLTRETQDPDSLSVCLDEAGMYTHEANPACDFGEPVSGVFKLYFTQPTDEPRPFNVTIGDDPTVMMCQVTAAEFNGETRWVLGQGLVNYLAKVPVDIVCHNITKPV